MNGTPPNGEAAIARAASEIADVEMRKRMCAAELQAVLDKYGMIAVSKELRINGEVARFEIAVEPKQAQQQTRIAVPQR